MFNSISRDPSAFNNLGEMNTDLNRPVNTERHKKILQGVVDKANSFNQQLNAEWIQNEFSEQPLKITKLDQFMACSDHALMISSFLENKDLVNLSYVNRSLYSSVLYPIKKVNSELPNFNLKGFVDRGKSQGIFDMKFIQNFGFHKIFGQLEAYKNLTHKAEVEKALTNTYNAYLDKLIKGAYGLVSMDLNTTYEKNITIVSTWLSTLSDQEKKYLTKADFGHYIELLANHGIQEDQQSLNREMNTIFKHLPYLEELRFSNHYLPSQMFEGVSWENLKKLDISSSFHNPAHIIRKAPKLEELRLHWISEDIAFSDEEKPLQNLKKLYLGNINNIHTLQDIIKDAPLEELILINPNDSRIDDFIVANDFSSLKRCKFINCHLNDHNFNLLLESLQKTGRSQLTDLDISENPEITLTEINQEDIGALSNVTKINVSKCTSIDPQGLATFFSAMPHLRELDISKLHLKEEAFKGLSRDLMVLTAKECTFTEPNKVVKALFNFITTEGKSSLKELHLTKWQISHRYLPSKIEAFRDLHILNLQGSLITSKAMNWFITRTAGDDGISSLEDLNISGTYFALNHSNVPYQRISPLAEFTYRNVTFNHLKRLSAEYTGLDYQTLHHLIKDTQIESISIGYNQKFELPKEVFEDVSLDKLKTFKAPFRHLELPTLFVLSNKAKGLQNLDISTEDFPENIEKEAFKNIDLKYLSNLTVNKYYLSKSGNSLIGDRNRDRDEKLKGLILRKPKANRRIPMHLSKKSYEQIIQNSHISENDFVLSALFPIKVIATLVQGVFYRSMRIIKWADDLNYKDLLGLIAPLPAFLAYEAAAIVGTFDGKIGLNMTYSIDKFLYGDRKIKPPITEDLLHNNLDYFHFSLGN